MNSENFYGGFAIMKEYIAPDIEKLEYDVDDCLVGSEGIPTESEDISDLI